jgi:hypothetical protein
VKTVIRYLKGNVGIVRRRGITFLIVGVAYFLLMATRLLASILFNKDESWFFDGALPAFFHVVLSCFLITHGSFIFLKGKTRLYGLNVF